NYSRRNCAIRSFREGRKISPSIRYRHDPLHLLRDVRGSLSGAGDFPAQGLRHYRLHAGRHGPSQRQTSGDRRSNARSSTKMEREEMSGEWPATSDELLSLKGPPRFAFSSLVTCHSSL